MKEMRAYVADQCRSSSKGQAGGILREKWGKGKRPQGGGDKGGGASWGRMVYRF